MGINTIPVVENGVMYIRGVKVELLATPSQTWDVTIHGAVYHITQEQEASLLRAVLYHDDYPSPYRISQLIHSGKERRPPSPAMMAQMVIVSHTCIDDTNTKKPCSEVFGIRGYGYMSKWRAFCYGLPYAIAICFWFMLVILMGDIIMWLFHISPGTPFSVSNSVIQSLLIFAWFTVIELCFKPGREYLRQWFNNKPLWVAIILWIGIVMTTAIQNHKALADRPDNFTMALAPIIAISGGLLAMLISAVNCYLLIHYAIKEGEDLDTIDKYA